MIFVLFGEGVRVHRCNTYINDEFVNVGIL